MKTHIYRFVNGGQGCKTDNGRWPKVRFVKHQSRHALSSGSNRKRIFPFMISLLLVITSAVNVESQEEGTMLVLGVRADAPPFCSFDSSKETPKEARGYTIDLCKRIAKRAEDDGLYCGIEYKAVRAADRLKALANGEIHVLCGATTVTLERMRIADFSLFTFLSGASVMYLSESIQKKLKTNEPLMVGVLEKTTSESQAKQILMDLQRKNRNFGLPAPKKVDVETVENHYQGLKQLVDGSIEAYVADREILLALRQKDLQDRGTTRIVVSEDYYTVEQYAIGIQTGKPELRFIANSVLSELYDWSRLGTKDENIFTVLSSNFPEKRFSKSLEALFRLQRIIRGQPIIEPAKRAICP